LSRSSPISREPLSLGRRRSLPVAQQLTRVPTRDRLELRQTRLTRAVENSSPPACRSALLFAAVRLRACDREEYRAHRLVQELSPCRPARSARVAQVLQLRGESYSPYLLFERRVWHSRT